MLLTSFANVSDRDTDYERCVEDNPCKHDNESLDKLKEKERKEVMKCRIGRHLKCSQPPKDEDKK